MDQTTVLRNWSIPDTSGLEPLTYSSLYLYPSQYPILLPELFTPTVTNDPRVSVGESQSVWSTRGGCHEGWSLYRVGVDREVWWFWTTVGPEGEGV